MTRARPWLCTWEWMRGRAAGSCWAHATTGPSALRVRTREESRRIIAGGTAAARESPAPRDRLQLRAGQARRNHLERQHGHSVVLAGEGELGPAEAREDIGLRLRDGPALGFHRGTR